MVVEFLSLEDEGEALADADAEGGDADAAALAGELVGDGAGEPGTGRPQRMPQGDGAALRVEDRRVELGPLGHAAEDLRGERLVEFEGGKVGEGLAGLGQCAGDGLDGGEAEVVRVEGGDAGGGDAGEGV